MPFPHLPYEIHPPLLGSQQSQQNHHGSTFLGRRLIDSYTGCRYAALVLSVLFILQTFGNLHDSGKEVIDAVNDDLVASTLMFEAIFQILMYVVVLLCLIMDIFVMNTRKLSIANSFWRPGILFFVITCGDHCIRLLNSSMNSQYFFDSCRKDMGPFTSLSTTIIVCDLQVQINCITAFAVFCRDMIASTIYIFSLRYYVGYRLRDLKRQYQDTLSLDYTRVYQSNVNDLRGALDPALIHPRAASDGFTTQASTNHQ